MTTHLYTGGLAVVAKSGVGQAVNHQRAMLRCAGVPVTESWRTPAEVVHINTVLPDSLAAALLARLRGQKVIWYGHSTEQDFRNSFVGSNLFAPLFRQWLRLCYRRADLILTPTPYARDLLQSYGLRRPVEALSNGVDTDFFRPDPSARARFCAAWGAKPGDKIVVSVGHYMQRKGILSFIELARAMPQVRFFWFGYTAPALVPRKIRRAMENAPANCLFPGFVSQAGLRDAYCAADAFLFCSHEETEGIVVLEALACGVTAVVRDIPVYRGWLHDGQDCYKAASLAAFKVRLQGLLDGSLPSTGGAGRIVAQQRSLTAVGQALCGLYRAYGIDEKKR